MEKINNKDGLNTKKYILLVEDEPIALRVHQMMLERLGYVVVHATTASKALAEYKEKKFNVILLDYGLPDFSGIELCKKIRSYEQLNRKEKSIALMLTAYLQDELLQQECRDAGVDEVAHKPITLQAMKDLLTRWLR